MGNVLAIAVVWTAVVLGIACMKKIQPNDIIYPAWAVFIAMAFTAFVLWYSTAG